MPEQRLTRRAAVRAGVAGGAAALAGCTLPTGPGGTTPDGDSGGTSDDPTASPTPAVPAGEAWPMLYLDPANSSRLSGSFGPGEGAAVRWTSDVLPEFPYLPLVRGDRLYAAGADHRSVYAVDAASGAELWRESFEESWLSLALHGGTLYVFTGAELRALRADDGSEAVGRTHDFGAPRMVTPVGETLYTAAELPDADQQVVVAFDRNRGTVEWTHRVDAFLAGIAVGEDRVYVTASDPTSVVAVDRTSGQRAWRVTLPNDSPTVYAPTLDDDRLYVGGLNFEHLFALEAGSGEELWRAEFPIPTGASLVDGGLVAGGAGELARFDRETGETEWRRSVDGTLTFPPTVTDDVLYTAEFLRPDEDLGSSHVYAVDPATGETAWRLGTDGNAWTAPAVVGDRLYGAFEDGRLYSVGAPR